MPEMDGLTLLAELRRKEFRARCILISAFLNDGVRQQAKHLGVDHILEKPVDVAALRGALAELLPTEGGRIVRPAVSP
jgi:YesN/AraC family two-component response regulator